MDDANIVVANDKSFLSDYFAIRFEAKSDVHAGASMQQSNCGWRTCAKILGTSRQRYCIKATYLRQRGN